jgi:hypothetical protein
LETCTCCITEIRGEKRQNPNFGKGKGKENKGDKKLISRLRLTRHSPVLYLDNLIIHSYLVCTRSGEKTWMTR